MKKTTILLPVIVVLLLLGFSSIFIVDEREKALVLQFGRVADVKEEPGLAFKIPLIQEVVTYDDRILSRDIDPLEVTPLDDRRLVVDAFARYRISDIRQFRQANGTGGIIAAESRLDSILRSQTREVLGSVRSDEILSADRAALMVRIRDAAFDEAQSLGLEIIDVRLKRTDLPSENLDATFARMRAEREREAADQIARGNERAQEIRAGADRQRVETVSAAQREAEIIRGQADARRNAIFAQAYGADEEFFEFYRSLDAYRQALRGDTSTMVMAPDGEFFNYLKNNNPGNAQPADTPMPDLESVMPEEGEGTALGTTGTGSMGSTGSADTGSGDMGSGDMGAGDMGTGQTGTGETESGGSNGSLVPLDDTSGSGSSGTTGAGTDGTTTPGETTE